MSRRCDLENGPVRSPERGCGVNGRRRHSPGSRPSRATPHRNQISPGLYPSSICAGSFARPRDEARRKRSSSGQLVEPRYQRPLILPTLGVGAREANRRDAGAANYPDRAPEPLEGSRRRHAREAWTGAWFLPAAARSAADGSADCGTPSSKYAGPATENPPAVSGLAHFEGIGRSRPVELGEHQTSSLYVAARPDLTPSPRRVRATHPDRRSLCWRATPTLRTC
jgi:hypothetical protein